MLASPLTLRTHDLPVRNKRLKVRTGCVTCKIRKVKCDEGKPACMRCTSTGRSCDGYAPVPDRMRRKQPVAAPVGAVARRSQHTRLQISTSSVMVDASLLSHDLYPNERQWINVFSCKTGPALAGAFGETFWSHLLPQLSLREPAIRHAVMAVSFSHAHFEASMMASKVDARAIGSREFGLYQYNKAIARLQQHMDCESELEVPLVCSLLFICLECMYGNQTLMLSHLRNGLNILSIASSRPSKSSLALELRHIFHRLDAQSTLFGKPASMGMNLEAVVPLPVPTTFGGFDEAKRCLDLLITASLNFVQASRDPSSPVGGVAATERQTQLQGLFLDWEDALGALVALSTADHREKLLRIQFTASFIYLSTCLEAGETVYDSYLNSFIKLVNWARFVHTAPRGQPHSPFTLDINTIPPLFLTGTKCRHPIVRRQAVALLESSPNREGLWNARLHGRVARRIIEIEESSSVLEATDTMSLGESTESTLLHEGKTSEMLSRVPITAKLGRWVQEKLRVCDAEIHPIADGASVVKVTFYTAPQGMNGEWASWTEELSFRA